MFATFLPFWGAPTSTNKSHDARSPSRRGRPARHDRRSGMFPELLNRLLCSAEVYDPHVEAAPVISSLHLHSDFFTSDDDDERTSTTKLENFSSSPTTTPTLATTSEEEEGHADVVATPNISPFTVTDTRVMVQPITTHSNTDVARLRRPRINERRPRRRNMRASSRPDSPPITLLAKVVDESAHADDANDVPPMPSFSSCTSATEEQEDKDHPSDLSRHAWMSRRRCLAPTSCPSPPPPPPPMNDEYDAHLALRTASLYPLASHAYVDRIIFCQHTQQCFALLTRLTAAHDHAWSLHLRLYQLYYYYVAPLLHGRSMSELPPDVQQSAILQPPLSRMEQRQMEHQLLHTGTGAVKRFHASFIPAVPTASSKSSACEGDDDDDDDEQRSSVVLDYQVFTYRFDATWSALLRSVKAFIAEPQIPTPSTSQSSTDDGTTATEVEERWPPMQQQSSVSFAATMLHSMELFERDCEVQVAIQEIERWVCWCREIFFATRMHDAKAVATQSAASRHVDETEPTSFGAIATTATTTSHHSPINWTYAQQERISERIALERQHARWLVIQRAREDGSWKKKPPTPTTPTPTPPAEQQRIVDDGGGGRGEREVPSAPRAMRGANHRHVFHADDDAMEMHHRPINTSCFGFGGFFS